MTVLTGYIYSRISVKFYLRPGRSARVILSTTRHSNPTTRKGSPLYRTKRLPIDAFASSTVFDDGTLEEALGVLAEDLTRGDHVREGAPRGDVHDGEAGGVAGADDGALSLGHGVGVCVR